MKRVVRVGVDIGGTFTDLVFAREDGGLDRLKVPSTPDDYSRAIAEGVASYLAGRVGSGAERATPGGVSEIVHATTVATNAILERRGARTALVTTDGFRDVLELRRIRIPFSYDLGWDKPAPLVERYLRFEVRERMDRDGTVLTPLDDEDVAAVIDRIASEEGIESIAVCLLHSYRNPAHERAVGAALRARLPGMNLSLSHEVLPEIKEFERTSTTVVNAYVAPLIGRYLERLRESLHAQEVAAPILVMQSNGGLVPSRTAVRQPVTIIESGPAAGVVAAAELARRAGHPNIITLDMGGTTTKASIIEGGEMLRATEYEVGSPVSVSSRLVRGSGYLLRIPVIDISEVGAGGGSIAAMDVAGAIRVGPRSAGADPGPACYGRGSADPTVTDANLVLGYLHPTSLAGGALRIDRSLAEHAVSGALAGPSGLSVTDAAYGVHLIANSNMVRAIKSVSVERGRDPAGFILMAFGGAGPLHACGVAQSLGIGTVLVPPAPGLFSAFGLLRAEVEHHTVRTVLTGTGAVEPAAVQRIVDEMRDDLVARAREEGFDASDVACAAAFDLRYAGQSSEITVAIDATRVDEAVLREVERRFEEEYERTYGHRGAVKAFELVNCRLVARIARAGPSAPSGGFGDRGGEGATARGGEGATARGGEGATGQGGEGATGRGGEGATARGGEGATARGGEGANGQGGERVSDRRREVDNAGVEGRTGGGSGGTREVYFGPERGWMDTPIIVRDDLDATARPGPSIVEEYDSTVVVPPGWDLHRDEYGNIVLRMGVG